MFSKSLLVCLFLFALTQPAFASFRTENITVTQGERVQLRCPLPRNFLRRENIIQWKKIRTNEDDLIISINGKVPKTLEKYYLTDLNDQWSGLELFHANRQDSTSYLCQTFETQTILCQYNLVVLIKPEYPLLTVSEEIIEEGQTVTLTCSSTNGNPAPSYRWFRNGTILTSLNQQVSVTGNSSTYSFRASRLDNQVKYECQISNQALTVPLRLETYLHVKYRPSVNIVDQPRLFGKDEKLVAIENNPLTLTCQIDANPAVTSIYWTVNGTSILSRDINLHWNRISSEQSGIYTCVVENSIGKSNQSIVLDVQYAPRVHVLEARLIVNRSDSISLRCSVDSNPTPYKIIWFKNGYEIFRQNQLSDLRIDQVERNDSGLYSCFVFNRFEDNSTRNGSATIDLLVQTRPVLETTYSKLAAEIGQSLTLTCRVSGEPKPKISWLRDDRRIDCDEIVEDKCYLRLMKMTEKDFGGYRCVAENLLGREEWSYTIVSRAVIVVVSNRANSLSLSARNADRCKPETPNNIRVVQITSSSFKIQFSPSFDGGAGPQRFLLEVTGQDKNKTIDNSVLSEQLPFNAFEYTVKDLNESTFYTFRLKATNVYGESPWSEEQTIQTLESIITPDDLPQLHVVSYNNKEKFLQFDYLPGDERWIKLNNNQLCLQIRQSSDGNIYQSIEQCLPIENNRVYWSIKKDFSYLKLSICSKKHRNTCGQEIEMKEDLTNRDSTAMIIGIGVIGCFLILIVLLVLVFVLCRWKKQRSTTNRSPSTNKFGISSSLDQGIKPIISEPRLQNPYLLYGNGNSHSSPYDFSSTDYQQRKVPSSFSQPVDQPKDELSVHDAGSNYGTANRTATIRASPHWLMNSAGTNSRSTSNPSSEFSCLTQNTNLIFPNNELCQNSATTNHYGFPPSANLKPQNFSSSNGTNRNSSIDQQQSSSGNSTPNRIKKLFYEVVV